MSAPSPPAPSPGSRLRASLLTRRRISLGLLVVAILGGGLWRYRITRPDYRLARGQQAVRDRDWDTVSELANRLEAAGQADHAHLLRGEALLERHHPDLALRELNKVRAEGPHRLQVAALAGRCLLDLGDLREAQRVLSFVISEQPENAAAHRGLAAIAYDLGQLGDAVDHLTRVAELDPADFRPHRLIGLIYKDMAQDAQAEAAYREALKRGGPSAVEQEVRVELAEVLVRQAKFADGLAVLEGGPSAVPAENPAGTAARAGCLRGLGRQQEAAGALDGILGQHPTAALYRLRGQVYQDQGQLTEALKCFERAVERAPTDHQSHYLLAQAYAALGRKDDAARAFERVEELRKDLDRITALTKEAMQKPWDPAVRLQLADLCERMDKPELAAMWRKAAAACSGSVR